MFQGRCPTGISAMKRFVAVSSTCTLPLPPDETNTRLPSGCTTTPFERGAAGMRCTTSWRATSITATTPALSHGHGLHDLAFRDVDDVDRIRVLRAHVEPARIRAPHRVLGVLAAHLHPFRDGGRGGVHDRHFVVLLDRRGEPLAVARKVD